MKNKTLNLNIACGDTYLANSSWINIDYESNNKNVTQCDILKKIPFKENSFSNIYSSHFIEHIPLEQIDFFLKMCFKLLKQNGKIRIVTPDFIEIINSYIEAVQNDEIELSEFIKIELLDQLVRNREGGRLRYVFKKYINENNNKMINIINERLGYNLLENSKKNNREKKTSYFKIISNRITNFYIKFIINFLPSTFKNQNVLLTKVGENHKWLWDYYDLKKKLESIGFKNVIKKDFNNSGIENFPFELDQKNNLPRKGIQSMFVEAEKN